MFPTARILHSAVRDRTKTIGFIGLGAMGREMAANIVSKTFAESPDPSTSFVIHDVSEQSVTRFLTTTTSLHPGRSISPASSPAGVAQLSSTIITMLPSSPQVKDVYTGENGILEGLAALGDPATDSSFSTLCIDSTTLDPKVALEVATQVKAAGLSSSLSASATAGADQQQKQSAFDMIDAPVSGGVVGARAGSLSFMVGSDSAMSFKQAEAYLLKMGNRAVHCGKNTNGLIAKIANNLLLGISMLGTCEAMLLGTAHGLSPQMLAHILNTSTGKCWSSEVNNPAPGALQGTDKSPPADRDWEGGFASRLMSKDLGLAMSAARLEGVPVPLGQLANQIYQALGRTELYMNKDFGVAFKALADALGRPEFREDPAETKESC